MPDIGSIDLTGRESEAALLGAQLKGRSTGSREAQERILGEARRAKARRLEAEERAAEKERAAEEKARERAEAEEEREARRDAQERDRRENTERREAEKAKRERERKAAAAKAERARRAEADMRASLRAKPVEVPVSPPASAIRQQTGSMLPEVAGNWGRALGSIVGGTAVSAVFITFMPPSQKWLAALLTGGLGLLLTTTSPIGTWAQEIGMGAAAASIGFLYFDLTGRVPATAQTSAGAVRRVNPVPVAAVRRTVA